MKVRAHRLLITEVPEIRRYLVEIRPQLHLSPNSIDIERQYYSVPFNLMHEQVEARIRSGTVEIFHKNRRVAIHARSTVVGGFSTLPEHRPPKHRHYLEWTPERLIDWARNIGPSAAAVAGHILQ